MDRKKVALVTLVGLLIVMLVVGAALGIYSLAVIYGTTTITLDESKTYQTMEGFGASSAWTYQALGAIEDEEVKEQAMEMLYGDSGLKLDTFRYNIGGGGTEVSGYPDPLSSRFPRAT